MFAMNRGRIVWGTILAINVGVLAVAGANFIWKLTDTGLTNLLLSTTTSVVFLLDRFGRKAAALGRSA
jgi:hypothetical protein